LKNIIFSKQKKDINK